MMLCTTCTHMGLDCGRKENGYHVTKGLAQLIVFFLPNYAFLAYYYDANIKHLIWQVLSKLPADPKISHEEFKGALYITLQTQLLLKPDWELQCSLWPLLIRAQHNEKPSIAALLKSLIGYIHSVDNWTIKESSLTETATGRSSFFNNNFLLLFLKKISVLRSSVPMYS